MEAEPSRTPDEPAGAVIDLWKEPSGEWRWRYRETKDHTELLSNEDYQSRGSAERAARISYPGVPIVKRELEVEPGSKTFWLLLTGGGLLLAFVVLALLGLVALVIIAIGWRGFRRRLRRLLRR